MENIVLLFELDFDVKYPLLRLLLFLSDLKSTIFGIMNIITYYNLVQGEKKETMTERQKEAQKAMNDKQKEALVAEEDRKSKEKQRKEDIKRAEFYEREKELHRNILDYTSKVSEY